MIAGLPVTADSAAWTMLSKTRLAMLVALVLALTACVEEQDTSASLREAVSSTADSGDSALADLKLEITGNPPSEVLVGASFQFAPTVVNPNGVSLTFTGKNIPGWAKLNASTGELTGQPGQADVGVYNNISVTVSGGGASDTTPAFAVSVVEVALGTATLSWAPPTVNTDGSSLSKLAGYRIYYGQSSTLLNRSISINDPGLTSYVVQNLTPATWYFAASSFDSAGLESSLSRVVSKTIN